ncbi:hypothetical protein RHMOL_Rhmol10G0193000 [Rhododendron molle]|uniref:Uncharacterized protein n=1 Tax=Rhododendron molle TaxID=49168 RepID=A0ACC0M425_RHOML|nr:hypothetical protein RHMOL_Rhmol10G0193000 [Rhododendron molle]
MNNITGNELNFTSEEIKVYIVVTHLIRQIQMMCGVAVIVVHVVLERYYSRHHTSLDLFDQLK